MASAETPESVIHRFAILLDSAGISYMLTGSFASGFHGSPRATHDIDFVISPTLGMLARLIDNLPSDAYYVDRKTALEAYGNESLFNVIDMNSGWKIDFICRKSRPFSITEFERRTLREFAGIPVYIASAEDSILSKLEWAKLTQSERQLADAAGILRMQKTDINLNYIEHWVHQLDLTAQWNAAKGLAASDRAE
jgi:hypothetical protein